MHSNTLAIAVAVAVLVAHVQNTVAITHQHQHQYHSNNNINNNNNNNNNNNILISSEQQARLAAPFIQQRDHSHRDKLNDDNFLNDTAHFHSHNWKKRAQPLNPKFSDDSPTGSVSSPAGLAGATSKQSSLAPSDGVQPSSTTTRVIAQRAANPKATANKSATTLSTSSSSTKTTSSSSSTSTTSSTQVTTSSSSSVKSAQSSSSTPATSKNQVATVSSSTTASTTTSKAATTTTTTKATSTSQKASSATSSKNSALTLPTPPSSSCATMYTDISSGAVYGPGLGDFPMSPRPSTFVKRSGAKLTLDGETYRMVGPNIYWLGLDENVIPNPSYPDKGRVREAMAITVAMGGNTIRSHTLGISTGNSLSLWPSNGKTNAAAWDSIDYAIFAARNYGLRLLIPLSDNYAYYHGGKYDFIGWAGLSKSDGNQFYTSSAVVKIFKAYISVLLNHVNTYTGVALKDDPTILGWETGNEYGGYMLGGGAPPASWTSSIATYVKSIAPNHLVFDGTDGLVDSSGNLQNTGFGVSNVDGVTDHFYPALDWLLTKDKGLLASQTTKNYFVGELDWTGQQGGDTLSSFYTILEGMSGSGSMIWSVFGHDANCCDYVTHNDNYSLLYPNGNTKALQAQILLVVQHWYRMRGLTPPKTMPAVACPQPALKA
ncbi:glycoside hydrolase [Meredithblackwellia eburnea MCA 4105]